MGWSSVYICGFNLYLSGQTLKGQFQYVSYLLIFDYTEWSRSSQIFTQTQHTLFIYLVLCIIAYIYLYIYWVGDLLVLDYMFR